MYFEVSGLLIDGFILFTNVSLYEVPIEVDCSIYRNNHSCVLQLVLYIGATRATW